MTRTLASTLKSTLKRLRSTFPASTLAIAFLILGIQPASAIDSSDYGVQAAIERHYESKMHLAFPDLQFSVQVALNSPKTIKLGILKQAISMPRDGLLQLDRVNKVRVLGNKTIPLSTLANVLSLKQSQLSYKMVEFLVPDKQQTKTDLQSNQTSPNDKTPSPTPLPLTPIAILMGAALLSVLFALRSSRLQKTLEKGFTSVSTSQNQPVTAAPTATSTQIQSGFESQKMDLSHYSEHQLVSLLAECYWTENDAQAGALIRLDRRSDIYSELSFSQEYIEYLKHIEPSNNPNFIEDPYFIQPHPELFHLSVIETPKNWGSYVSRFRFEKMQLSPLDILTLKWEKPHELGKQSAHRTLNAPIAIELGSVKEESDLLETLSEDQKIQLPSLYRLTRLPDDDAKKLLEGLNATELASAWIGPSPILSSLENFIPERKLKLMQSILESGSTASRKSPAFLRLMLHSDEILKATQSKTTQSIKADKHHLAQTKTPPNAPIPIHRKKKKEAA